MTHLTTIKQFVEFQRQVCRENWDATICVTGERGVGKSVFMMKFLEQWSEGTFNPVRDMAFSREELNNLIDNKPQYGGIMVDEAIGVLFNRTFADAEQVALAQKLDRCRHQKLAVLFGIPEFSSLDKHVRNSAIRFWVYVHKRTGKYAHAYVFMKDDAPAAKNGDRWNIRDLWRYWHYGTISKSRNYQGEIRYHMLDKHRYGIYDAVKTLKRQMVEEKEAQLARNYKIYRKPRRRNDELNAIK